MVQELSAEEHDGWLLAEDWGDECWSDEWRNREAERQGPQWEETSDVERMNWRHFQLESSTVM